MLARQTEESHNNFLYISMSFSIWNSQAQGTDTPLALTMIVVSRSFSTLSKVVSTKMIEPKVHRIDRCAESAPQKSSAG
jgi:hypothetical protein